VPGVFPGGKGGRCIRLTTLPPSCAVVMKSGYLNFLEPSGPLYACNGTALWCFSRVTRKKRKERRKKRVKNSYCPQLCYMKSFNIKYTNLRFT